MSILNRQFPHLLPEDITVWQAFLTAHPNRWTEIDYDVRIGPGVDPGPEHTTGLRKMGKELSQMRIDAVGHMQNAIEIIEITQLAGLKAIGQLMTYPIFFQADFNPKLTLAPLLVCTSLRPGIDLVLAELHIAHIIVNV